MYGNERSLPPLIQAGMGAHISSARLANATARLGALGVVSGVGLRKIVLEQIRAGDPVAIEMAASFPLPSYAEAALEYAPGGARHRRPIPMDTPDPKRSALPRQLSVLCAYVEVKRAQQGHRGLVGINVMWKCALTALPTIYGAMLAGVDALLCGAGVPMELPDIVQRIRAGEDLTYQPLTGTGTNVHLEIAPDQSQALLARFAPPSLLPILSNFAFCKRLLETWEQKYTDARPTAFVLENHAAGGHNAPPRNKVAFGEQDDIDTYFEKVKALGVPLYVAGAFPNGGDREDLLAWQQQGAHGIQVGSRFALCEESGMRPDLKKRVIEQSARHALEVVTDSRLSPTGYPFKYVRLPHTLSEPGERRVNQKCDLGYLLRSHLETLPDGTTRETYLCPGMPPAQYARRGGDPAETEGRICLCNALLATAGYADEKELPLVTLGESGSQIVRSWTAREIVEDILTPEYVAQRERALRCEDTPLPSSNRTSESLG